MVSCLNCFFLGGGGWGVGENLSQSLLCLLPSTVSLLSSIPLQNKLPSPLESVAAQTTDFQMVSGSIADHRHQHGPWRFMKLHIVSSGNTGQRPQHCLWQHHILWTLAWSLQYGPQNTIMALGGLLTFKPGFLGALGVKPQV